MSPGGDAAGQGDAVDDGGQPGHDSAWWDARHRARAARGAPDDVDPSVRAAVVALRPAGVAVDLACGTGRHTRWLARQGWTAVGVDSSPVGVDVARAATARAGLGDGLCRYLVADARTWEPAAAVGLVVVAFVALPDVVARAAAWLAPGGRLVVVGHAVANATRGVGGPKDPRLLHDPAALAAGARQAGLRLRRSAEVLRPVDFGDDDGGRGVQVDAVLVADR